MDVVILMLHVNTPNSEILYSSHFKYFAQNYIWHLLCQNSVLEFKIFEKWKVCLLILLFGNSEKAERKRQINVIKLGSFSGIVLENRYTEWGRHHNFV